MNFFGHAVAATWIGGGPAFAFGAMLPDLVQMVGSRLVSCEHIDVAAGIDFHHATDKVFHENPTFAELEHWSRRRLDELGVRKGPRRALAHVGLELMLDAVLARVPGNLDAYHRALAIGQEANGLSLGDSSRDAALSILCGVLIERSPRLIPRSAEATAERMARVLERRPRLCYDASERAFVIEWTREAEARVDAVAGSWVSELQRGIAPIRPV